MAAVAVMQILWFSDGEWNALSVTLLFDRITQLMKGFENINKSSCKQWFYWKRQLLNITGATGHLMPPLSVFSIHHFFSCICFHLSVSYCCLFFLQFFLDSHTIHTADKISFEVGCSILTVMITYNHIGWISSFSLTYIFSESKHTASHNWDPMFRCGGNENTIPSILLASCALWSSCPPLALQLCLHI